MSTGKKGLTLVSFAVEFKLVHVQGDLEGRQNTTSTRRVCCGYITVE